MDARIESPITSTRLPSTRRPTGSALSSPGADVVGASSGEESSTVVAMTASVAGGNVDATPGNVSGRAPTPPIVDGASGAAASLDPHAAATSATVVAASAWTTARRCITTLNLPI